MKNSTSLFEKPHYFSHILRQVEHELVKKVQNERLGILIIGPAQMASKSKKAPFEWMTLFQLYKWVEKCN